MRASWKRSPGAAIAAILTTRGSWRDPQQQADLFVVRARAVLVEARTMLINFARGITKTTGHRLPASSTHCFSERVRKAVPEALQPALLPLLKVLERISEELDGYDENIEALAGERYPETRWLRQAPGVGPITALTFLLTLSDPARFVHSRDVGPFLGWVPRRRQSGEQDPHLRISKCGDRKLRKLLVQCAHVVMGRWARLRVTALGAGARTAQSHSQEAHGGGGGAKTRGAAPSAVGTQRSVSAISSDRVVFLAR